MKYLERSEKFRAFHNAPAVGGTESAEEETEEEESPMEILDAAFQQVNTALAGQLMDEVMKLTPIQAKQWTPEKTVHKPEIQKFAGVLQGKQAQKSLFITTAKFSGGAVQFAENLLDAKVVLVDGAALTRLMIRHNVGVTVEHVYEVKRLDSDFFTEEF